MLWHVPWPAIVVGRRPDGASDADTHIGLECMQSGSAPEAAGLGSRPCPMDDEIARMTVPILPADGIAEL